MGKWSGCRRRRAADLPSAPSNGSVILMCSLWWWAVGPQHTWGLLGTCIPYLPTSLSQSMQAFLPSGPMTRRSALPTLWILRSRM